ncbi:hypothetical protein [Marinivivus vitaminiproducens]|uniref:hypothetical protein n=1 Tax=Marinivivus vitaminiproducens TaxID=3035935 RepID=UPI0027A98163|nr:hypothetical protein P4R82_04885 [Geminicoccaceae bacterium SCSIO 64248]
MGSAASVATVGLNAALAAEQARRADKKADASADRQIAALSTQNAQAEAERATRLRAAMATARARAGAAGVGGSGGSTDAILKGMTEQAEADARAEQAALRERARDIRSSSGSGRSNLLEVTSTALQGSAGRSSRSSRSLLEI